MPLVIVFLIDDPPMIDIFSSQWIRGTLIFKSRYCVTRPRSLLVRNVASRYDPWPHFFFLRSRRSTRILSALGGEERVGKRKRRRELSRGWIAFSKCLGVGGITSNWTGNRPIVSFHAPFYFPRRICRGEIFAEGMIFHLCLRWRRDENDSVIRCKSFNKILYTEKFRNYLGRVTSCNIFWRQSYYKRVS